jgi:hypothetical protein
MAVDAKGFERYFRPTNLRNPLKVIGVGIVIFLIGFAAPAALAVGVIVIALGGFWVYSLQKGGVTDADVEAAIDRAGASAQQTGLQKLGLDPSEVNLIQPVVIEGPDFKKTRGKVRKGKDGIVRTAANKVLVLYFSEHMVHCYTYHFDITAPSIHTQETDEYFYRDVVSVATATEEEKISVKGKTETVNYDAFLLRNAGGESLRVAAYNGGQLAQSISGMRALIQQKKMAAS